MPGRRLITEAEAHARGLGGRVLARRREVLRETLAALQRDAERRDLHARAAKNLERWRAASDAALPQGEVAVLAEDWGVAVHALTRRHCRCFAVLNMANAYVPGGAYVEGAAAQEENMFRRTDCHFCIGTDEMDPATDRYRPEITALLSGAGSRVYLDRDRPRVCVRGPEDAAAHDLGYAWLAPEDVFPFFELRAAAMDLRTRPEAFDPVDARRRIAAQLDTLREGGMRFAVLSAFGCGAFANPADEVARIYRTELDARRADFDLIAFAIFHPGYGPDNHTPFRDAFA